MFRKGYYHCIVHCAIITIVAGLSYANFVSNKIYEDSRPICVKSTGKSRRSLLL